MLDPQGLTDFISGTRGDALAIAYEGSPDRLLLRRVAETHFVVDVPAAAGDPSSLFSIERALSDPMCGANFEIAESQVRITMMTRSQIRSVIKIALNHLAWSDESRLHFSF